LRRRHRPTGGEVTTPVVPSPVHGRRGCSHRRHPAGVAEAVVTTNTTPLHQYISTTTHHQNSITELEIDIAVKEVEVEQEIKEVVEVEGMSSRRHGSWGRAGVQNQYRTKLGFLGGELV
jgi:hypothetical protein